MKRESFEYKVYASIRISAEEVYVLRKVAEVHYDYHCRRSAEGGGFLWGWKNQTTPIEGLDLSPIKADSHELDTCVKILEQRLHAHLNAIELELASRLDLELRKCLHEINQEWRRLDEAKKA